jgi:L-alanine-DL-glutamate epimerase-like enolase superfamily enzyme
MPIGPTLERTRNRLQAVRDVAGNAELMLDAAWTWRSPPEAADYVTQLAPLGLSWVEDPFLPGDAASTAALRRMVSTPIAVGDEQGGGYFPEALLQANAIDILRLDATCSGGVSAFSELLRRARESGVRVSTHIFHQVHQALLCGFAESGATIECGHGNGVDPLSEALLMHDGPGFGFSLDPDRLGAHELHDPGGIFTF